MARRVVQRIGAGDPLEDIISRDNPLINTQVYRGGQGAVPIENWPYTPEDAQRQDGRPGTVLQGDAPFAPEYIEERLERKLLLMADPLYRFVRIVAGNTDTSVDEYWQGPKPKPTAHDILPPTIPPPVKTEEGVEKTPKSPRASSTRDPFRLLARLLIERDTGLTDADMRAFDRLFGSRARPIPQTSEWMEQPEQLGFLFLSPAIEAGILAARDDVWHMASRPTLVLHDLMTHNDVFGKFAQLTGLYIKRSRGVKHYQQVYTQKDLQGQIKVLRYWFKCVKYNSQGKLVYARSEAVRSEVEWQERLANGAFRTPTGATGGKGGGAIFEDLYGDQ